jgi:hypothetical protein
MLLLMLVNLGLGGGGVAAPVIPPTVEDQPSGGWGYYVRAEQESLRREYKRKRKREAEEAEREIQDAADREIARLLHEQEALDEARDERDRLRELAARYRHSEDVSERVRSAMARVVARESASALEELGREIERARDDEDIAALMVLLNQ